MQCEPNTVIFEDEQEFPVGSETGLARTGLAYFSADGFSFYKWRILVWNNAKDALPWHEQSKFPDLRFVGESACNEVSSHGEMIRRVVLHAQDIISKISYTTTDTATDDDKAPF